MKLSAQEEYGLRCLLQMARQGDEASVSIPEIARSERLSIPNVAKLMRVLRMAGLVKSVRGQAGGYRLARPAKSILVGDALEALGGKLFGAQFCVRHAGLDSICVHDGDCSMRAMWRGLQHLLEKVLFVTTLGDLLQREEPMQAMLESNHGTLILPAPAIAASINSSGA